MVEYDPAIRTDDQYGRETADVVQPADMRPIGDQPEKSFAAM